MCTAIENQLPMMTVEGLGVFQYSLMIVASLANLEMCLDNDDICNALTASCVHEPHWDANLTYSLQYKDQTYLYVTVEWRPLPGTIARTCTCTNTNNLLYLQVIAPTP